MIGSKKEEEKINSISSHVSVLYYKMVLLMTNINTFQEISIFHLFVMKLGIIEGFFSAPSHPPENSQHLRHEPRGLNIP